MARGVILDVDGTLVDSNDAHAQAWVDALREYGHDVDFARVRPLIGMGGDKLLPEVIGVAEDSPEGKAISERRADIFRSRHLPDVRGFPKARELVERLEREGTAVTIASSATKEDLVALLDKVGLRSLADHAASKDDAERSKPDPDIVHAALARLGLRPDVVVMVGDTPYDVEAAQRAGLRAIAFRCGGGWSDTDFGGATAIYDGPAELIARLDESPIAR
jgi:phosphoglycolate phosphatase-like HAD superfamily hydrolase